MTSSEKQRLIEANVSNNCYDNTKGKKHIFSFYNEKEKILVILPTVALAMAATVAVVIGVAIAIAIAVAVAVAVAFTIAVAVAVAFPTTIDFLFTDSFCLSLFPGFFMILLHSAIVALVSSVLGLEQNCFMKNAIFLHFLALSFVLLSHSLSSSLSLHSFFRPMLSVFPLLLFGLYFGLLKAFVNCYGCRSVFLGKVTLYFNTVLTK